MMRDIIISAFCNSTSAPNQKWADKYFKNPPLVLTMPGTNFRQKMTQWVASGDVFLSAVKELAPKELKNIEIGRRGLCTFSAGWAASDVLFGSEIERNRLDASITVDGIHTSNLNNYIQYGLRAARMEAHMIMAHTSIIPPFISSTKSNKTIFGEACKLNRENVTEPMVETDLPDYLVKPVFPVDGYTISVGAAGVPGAKGYLKPESKTYFVDPLIDFQNRGNMVMLGYSGNGRCDHVFCCWKTQERLWNYLGEMWS